VHISLSLAKLFYAILLSPSAPRHSVWALLRHVTVEKNPVQDRVIWVISLIDRLIPGIAQKLSRQIFLNNYFPWQAVPSDLIAYGTGAAVFHAKWRNWDNVLRVYKQSIGKSAAGLLEIARYYKKKYETVLAWYGGASELVLPMEFLVVEGLPFIGPVVVSFQPYVHGQKYDLFEDFSNEQLLKLLDENDFLREQFSFFIEQTLRQWNEKKECYDFLGRENVLLVKEGGEYRLRIVDVGCFRLDVPSSIRPEKMTRIEQRVERMVSLYRSSKTLTRRIKEPIYPHNVYGQLI
jgi:hypothetical protein